MNSLLHFKMKDLICLLVLLMLVGCTPTNDRPPKIDTPLPPAHDGIYKSKDAQFTFNGDGKTVIVSFSEAYLNVLDQALNDTEYHYTFTWYDFGEYRYDGATQLILVHEESKTSLNFNLQDDTSFDSIEISFPIPDKEVQVLQRVSD
jgi:hypothetical protein